MLRAPCPGNVRSNSMHSEHASSFVIVLNVFFVPNPYKTSWSEEPLAEKPSDTLFSETLGSSRFLHHANQKKQIGSLLINRIINLAVYL